MVLPANNCKRNHHRSLHNETINSNLSPSPVPFRVQDVPPEGNTNCAADHKKDFKLAENVFDVLQDTDNSSLRQSFYSQRSENEPKVRADLSSGTEGCRDPFSKVESISHQQDSLDKKLVAKKDEDGLFRAHGRLEDVGCLPEELRKPIILPKDHPFVIFLLRDLHERRGHCGYKSLVHEARKRFWIIGLRRMAKTVTSKCVICRKLRKRPLNKLMGQIPNLRVAAGFPAFSNTAMYIFGPVQIKLGRKTLKEAQVIIFACMTSRASHLSWSTIKLQTHS